MQSIRKRVLAAAFVSALALATSAVAADREAGPRGHVGKSPIQRFIQFIVHTLGDISIPPG